MSFQELAEQCAVYAQRIMDLERQLGECTGAVQTMERQIELLRRQVNTEAVPGLACIPLSEWVAIMGSSEPDKNIGEQQ